MVKSYHIAKNLILFIVLFILLVGCREEKMKKYEWRENVTTPEAYPAYLVSGKFDLEDGSKLRMFSFERSVLGDWGSSPYIAIVGEENKHLPTLLDIRWLSYVENQFYHAQCPLPTKKIQALFEQGYSEPWWAGERRYRVITVGVAPGGNLSVWLVGGKASVLLAACKGIAIDLTLEEVGLDWAKDRQEVLDVQASNYDERDGIQAFGTAVDLKKWDRYNKRLKWQPKLKGAPQGAFLGMRTYSAESYLFGVEKSPGQNLETHSVPKQFLLYIEKNKQRYIALVKFNEEEVFAAFNRFEKLSKGDSFELELHISETLRGLAVWLSYKEHIYVFEKVYFDMNKIS